MKKVILLMMLLNNIGSFIPMSSITYNERAKFYDKEVSIDKIKIAFFYRIQKELKIESAMYCPCGSGIYLNPFADIFEKSFFADINANMIEETLKKIKEQNISNVESLILDLRKIDLFNKKVDSIFVLDQAIQFIDYNDLRVFLKAVSNISKYIILDMFDFYKKGKLSYFDSTIPDNKLYKSKEFQIDTRQVTRYNSHILKDDIITFNYFYKNNLNEEYNTSFSLHNYSHDYICKVIEELNLFKIYGCFSNYDMTKYDENGHFIIILENILEV